MRRTRATLRALALVLSSSVSALAEPDPPSASEANRDPGAEAVEVGRAALDAYARGDWQAAFTKFAAAERFAHSPVFGLYMARCERNRGHLLEARALLRAVAGEQLSADAPPPWAQAVAAAHAELGTLQQNIPSILLKRRPDSQLRGALLDSRSIELSEAGSEVELNPGEHVIEVVVADGGRSRLSVQLREGVRRVPVLVPVPVAKVEVTAPPPASVPPAPIATSKVVAYSALGLGAVGVAAGLISGLVALQRTQDLKRESCDGTGSCYRDSRSDAEVTSRWATISTVSFVVGGGALAAGAGVLLFAPSAGTSHANLLVRGVF